MRASTSNNPWVTTAAMSAYRTNRKQIIQKLRTPHPHSCHDPLSTQPCICPPPRCPQQKKSGQPLTWLPWKRCNNPQLLLLQLLLPLLSQINNKKHNRPLHILNITAPYIPPFLQMPRLLDEGQSQTLQKVPKHVPTLCKGHSAGIANTPTLFAKNVNYCLLRHSTPASILCANDHPPNPVQQCGCDADHRTLHFCRSCTNSAPDTPITNPCTVPGTCAMPERQTQNSIHYGIPKAAPSLCAERQSPYPAPFQELRYICCCRLAHVLYPCLHLLCHWRAVAGIQQPHRVDACSGLDAC